MSKSSEQRALEAYPIKMTPLVYQDLIDQFGGKTEIDVNTYPRCLFQEGYEQAEKDTIERAVTWLKDNANKYIVDLTETYPDAPVNIIVGGMCWEDLTKYLKDNEQHREYTPRDREAKEGKYV